MFQILWRFETTDAQAEAFAAAYGPDGAWVAFFRQADGYRETELFRRQQSPPCFLTIDRWESRAAYERFRRDQAAAYTALDAVGGLAHTEALRLEHAGGEAAHDGLIVYHEDPGRSGTGCGHGDRLAGGSGV